MSAEDRKQAEEAAEKILLPDETIVEFLGYRIGMKPVPIAVAKELRRLPEKLNIALDKIKDDSTSIDITNSDIEASDLYTNIVFKLLSFYKTPITRDHLENEATVTQLKEFIDKQLKVQGEEDFLLEPLRRIIRVFSPKNEKKIETPITTPGL